VVGTGLVWIPFGSYLLIMGYTKEAIIFLSWNIIVVTNIDSFLRPYFMSGNVSASVLFIFLSILGGIDIFGMLGIFYGPLILAFALVMLDIYNEEYQIILKQKDSI
ncbi:MAG: AI-2E family transporter, partial [Desulfovibrionaceae bacterium]|nr:AI-2E family transporter [Desulfovibrionaceae bacterium]